MKLQIQTFFIPLQCNKGRGMTVFYFKSILFVNSGHFLLLSVTCVAEIITFILPMWTILQLRTWAPSHTCADTKFVSVSLGSLGHTVTCKAAVLANVSVATREKHRTEQDFSNNAAAGLSVCVCEREREKERQSLLSQASHYVGCNLSFRGLGWSSDCTEWGSSTGPRCLSCAFTLLSSATLIINREGGVGVWGRGVAEVWVYQGWWNWGLVCATVRF